jgi:hypothetical protein
MTIPKFAAVGRAWCDDGRPRGPWFELEEELLSDEFAGGRVNNFDEWIDQRERRDRRVDSARVCV